MRSVMETIDRIFWLSKEDLPFKITLGENGWLEIHDRAFTTHTMLELSVGHGNFTMVTKVDSAITRLFFQHWKDAQQMAIQWLADFLE